MNGYEKTECIRNISNNTNRRSEKPWKKNLTNRKKKPGKGFKFLLAEDNEVNSIYIEGLLSDMPHTVITGSNGKEAVEAAGEGDYELILMDIQMPVMDGYTAINKIRAFPSPASAIPIIALTAYAGRENRKKALGHGTDIHISKPIDFESLSRVVSRLGLQKSGMKETPANRPKMDTNTLEKSRKDPSFFVDLADGSVETIGTKKRNYKNALKNRRHDTAAAELHAIGGVAAIFGLKDLRRMCFDIEEKLKIDLEQIPEEKFMEINAAFSESIGFLESLSQEL